MTYSIKIALFSAVVCSLGWMAPVQAGIMRGDCSIFQEQEDGIPDFDDCDVTLKSGSFDVQMVRTDRSLSIPVDKIIAADVTSYTVEDFKARTAFALTYQSDHPDGFDILTFRLKSKRSVTAFAALRQLLNVEINTDL